MRINSEKPYTLFKRLVNKNIKMKEMKGHFYSLLHKGAFKYASSDPNFIYIFSKSIYYKRVLEQDARKINI